MATRVKRTNTLARETVYLKYIVASATGGGTATAGSYQTRALNTLENPASYTWVSLNSNQITLAAGTYEIYAACPNYFVGRSKSKLRNVTDSTDVILGNSNLNNPIGSTAYDTNHSIVAGVFTITSAKVFEIQTRVESTVASTGHGFPASFGDSEVHAIVKITKIETIA